ETQRGHVRRDESERFQCQSDTKRAMARQSEQASLGELSLARRDFIASFKNTTNKGVAKRAFIPR
ncbi:hypothetical protein A2U01_0075950, partial [Trifolium medium]|nr:hypothetical protein [Trifolium medium]